MFYVIIKKPPAENEEEEGAGGSEEPPAATGFVSDLLSDSKIFEWAGIGFGEVESYRILKSLKVKHLNNKSIYLF